ncbi:MAG TPA: carboxypeptidase regulatory-like domain-containing protein [Panacibacter sp.]|nr:carboxypeptidase regulatory-like domain-containing protein [Panacibacter sp.]
MNAKLESKLDMYRATQTYCDNNMPIVSTVPAFATAFTAFKANVTALIANAQQEDQVTKGITTDKKVSKKTLAQLGADVAAPIFAYASSINDNTLKAQVNFSFSDLFKAKDELLPVRCQNIHDAGTAHLLALADFGITAPLLASLQTTIIAYKLKVPTPRNAAADKITIRLNQKNLFTATDLILKEQMDKTLAGFKAANPDFVNTYKANRVIIDPGKVTTELTGTVTNSVDSSPIKGASILIEETGVTTTTTPQGKYQIKPISHGTYTIKVTRTGYQDNIQSKINVKLGQVNKLDIALIPVV